MMDFASVELFSTTYIELYLTRKCKIQQTCKQNVEKLAQWQAIHSSYIHEICYHVITLLNP